MFCKNCGSEIAEGERFCRNCGTPAVVENTSAPEAAPQPAQPTQPAPDFNQGSWQQPPQPQYDPYAQNQGFNGAPYDMPPAPEGVPGVKAKVTFGEAVKLFFTNYAKFSGRSVAGEYWFVFLFNLLVSFAIGIITAIVGQKLGGAISTIYSLAVIIPSIAVGVRRMHDTGRSGWSLLIGLIPIVGTIIEIVWLAGSSDSDNEYGPAPRY